MDERDAKSDPTPADASRGRQPAVSSGQTTVGSLSAGTGAEHARTDPSTPTPSNLSLSDRYEVLQEIGRGGMGIVYRARDRETGESVALKVLRPEIAGDQSAMERFKNELRLARKITHKNVCRIHEFSRAGAVAYISMEFVEGESLRGVLKRFSNLSIRKGLDVARQVCEGLDEAHKQGVVHRDLKPENIMIDGAGDVKIMDFGVARSLESSSTQTGTLLGTPAYMSPEQAQGKPADARSDIYSLGLILYELLTGEPAISGDTPLTVALKQMHEQARPPREIEASIPVHVERAILRCLEKDAAKRFQAVEELQAALDQPVAVEPAPAPVSGDEPLAIPLHLAVWRRRDWLLLGCGFISLAVFAVLFDRVFPFASCAPRVSAEAAVERARVLFERYGPQKPVGNLTAEHPLEPFEGFVPLVLQEGLAEAHRRAQKYATSWTVYGRVNGRVRYRASFLPDGRLEGLDVSTAGPDQAQATEEVVPLAARYAEELFGVQVAGIKPEHVAGPSKWQRWTLVHWITRPGTEGDAEVIGVRVFPGRLEAAWRYPAERVDMRTPRYLWPWHRVIVSLCVIAALVLCMVLFFVRRLYAVSLPSVWGFSAFIALLSCVFVVLSYSEFLWLAVPLGFVLALLVSYAVLAVPWYYLSKSMPSRLASAARLARDRTASLAIVRAALLALCYLAIVCCLLFVAGYFRWAAASNVWALGISNKTPWWTFSFAAVAAVVIAWVFIALPACVLGRLGVPARWLVLAPAFLMTMAGGIPLTWIVPELPLVLFAALQGLFFVLVFVRYDLLTCTFAVFTVNIAFFNLGLFRMYGHFEPWTYGWPLLVWLAMPAIALIALARPRLSATWRRLAAAFE